jgi:hypothetical protein
VKLVDVNATLEYLREQYGICTESQLDEAIRRMRKIDIGVFAGKDGGHGSGNHGSTGIRGAADREGVV